jgi:hypothetical protein
MERTLFVACMHLIDSSISALLNEFVSYRQCNRFCMRSFNLESADMRMYNNVCTFKIILVLWRICDMCTMRSITYSLRGTSMLSLPKSGTTKYGGNYIQIPVSYINVLLHGWLCNTGFPLYHNWFKRAISRYHYD